MTGNVALGHPQRAFPSDPLQQLLRRRLLRLLQQQRRAPYSRDAGRCDAAIRGGFPVKRPFKQRQTLRGRDPASPNSRARRRGGRPGRRAPQFDCCPVQLAAMFRPARDFSVWAGFSVCSSWPGIWVRGAVRANRIEAQNRTSRNVRRRARAADMLFA